MAEARAFMPAMVHSDDSRLEVFWPLSANAVAAVAATHSCGCYAAAAAIPNVLRLLQSAAELPLAITLDGGHALVHQRHARSNAMRRASLHTRRCSAPLARNCVKPVFSTIY